MKTFRMSEDGVSAQVEYCVLRCPACGSVFRHDLNLGAVGGRRIKNRACQVCGGTVPVDDRHSLDQDPMAGQYKAEFKTAKDL